MDGKTILITGASSGFGLLAAEILAGRGHDVIAGVRGGVQRLRRIIREEGLPALAEAERAGRLAVLDLHMDRPGTFASVEKHLDSSRGSGLDVLVNNAGFGLMGPVELHTAEELRRQLEVNFFGPVLLTQRLLPRLKKTKGRVLSVTSVAGRMAVPFMGSYCASKNALESYMEALRYDMEPFGVRVGLIEPGRFKTVFSKNATFGERALSPDSGYYERIESFRRARKGMFGRVTADPMTVARLIVRLCEAPRVPLRTLVGLDARAGALLKRILPDSLRAGLTRILSDWLVFKS
ncbi:MAG: SDR family oxidoreductase [Elusimicrobiota bacterium]